MGKAMIASTEIDMNNNIGIVYCMCGSVFFACVPTRWARLAFCLLENHLKKKRFGVATYFCFILKGKNKIRKKNPKYDS